MRTEGLLSALLVLAILLAAVLVVTATPPPSTPYIIHGNVFYKNGTACKNPTVSITNVNNSNEWTAKTSASYNYYELTLANGTDLNVSEVLQFYVTSPDGEQSKVLNHAVTETEVNNGGLFNFNITLEAPPGTPFIIYGWVNYNNGIACNGSTVNITNKNTSMHWHAETNASYNYYQLILDATNVSAGDVLEFNVSDGTQSNTTSHSVTESEINNGGLFNFNLTLPTPAEAPVVESITVTPDESAAEEGVQINPIPGANKTVNISAVVSDPNGWDDINTVVAVITGPYTVADSPVTLNLVSHDTTTAIFNGTLNMSFYYANGTYTVNVTATDMSNLTGSNSTTFDYQTAIALELDANIINFSSNGPINPGEMREVLGDENMSTLNNATIRNIGNVIIDVYVSGTNMTSNGNVIANNNIGVRIDNIPGEQNYYDLRVERFFDVNMPAGELSLENVDFKLFVPYGTPQGDYSGTITLTAVQS